MREGGKEATIRGKRMVGGEIASTSEESQLRGNALDTVKLTIRKNGPEGGGVREQRRRRGRRVHDAHGVERSDWLLRGMIGWLGRRERKGDRGRGCRGRKFRGGICWG